MSTDIKNGLADQTAQTQNQTIGERGEQWVKHYGEEFQRLPKGTIVAINCRTGEYVLASTRLQAIDEFERRFGKEPGYVHEIGGGVFVGWGGGIV
jgi:hypothetical protein